ncbi:MAG: hypothetical protein QF662_08855, partial [Phycisphaerae bacterium]|nr:hypothetical protein [Phycisphaerae bacterium]
MRTLRLHRLVAAVALLAIASPAALAASVKLGDSGITLTVETKEAAWGDEIAVKLSKPIEGKSLLAFIRPVASPKYAGQDWLQLKSSDAEGAVKFAIPEVPSDLYRLRFVLDPKGAKAAEARAVEGTQAGEVTIPIVNSAGSVTVLMEAFRNIFLEGERPRVNV